MPAFGEIMGRQEVYYSKPSNEYVYAKDIAELQKWQPIKGYIPHVVHGGALGWLGLIVDQQNNLVCGVEVGALFFFPKPPAPDGKRPPGTRIVFCE
jgi:hypothetical protein